MNKSTLAVLVILVSTAGAFGQDEPFERLKATMANAACCRYEFLSIVESEVFESTDTTLGAALIASDGRYHITIGPDEYLKTADKLYSYSSTENQMTVEALDTGDPRLESVSFVTRLNDYYSTRVVVPSRQYFLTRTDSAAVDLPDSLVVSLISGKGGLDRIEFFDVNNDRNRIVFRKSEYFDKCDDSALSPRFPDSAEVINLR
jgi:outer membrane lipoprotein-sorting protein